MQAIMNTLMLSCTKATELVEKKTVDGLSVSENMMLSMHTVMCSACRQYQKQSALLNRAIFHQLNHFPEEFSGKNIRLGSQARQRIQEEIERTLRNN